MKYILNQAQMQQCDINTMEHFGVISPVLMERAALCLTEEILKLRGPADRGKKPVLIVCGTGNNGGDGLAAARMLYQKQVPVEIWYPGDPKKASPEGARQLKIVGAYGIPVYRECPQKDYDVLVDALFGIGLTRDLGGIYRDVVAAMNAMSGKKLAVDICSGLNTDTGAVMGLAFAADVTVTFGFLKLGHLLYPGADYSGRVLCREMGIDEHSLLGMRPAASYMEASDLVPLTWRNRRTNKGDYGKLAIIAGSRNMAGAAALAARAAYAGGAGLVRVVTPACNRVIIQQLVPEAVLTTYEEDEKSLDFLDDVLAFATAIAAGPGLGTGKRSASILKAVLKGCSDHRIPLLLDADALNILAANPDWQIPADTILTPHPGEMARLSQIPVKDQENQMINVALDLAKGYNSIVMLKDAHTVIAGSHGQLCLNLTGNPGMATGGSGDALAGLVGYLLSLGLAPYDAACLGAYLHGAAGDRAAATYGQCGMTAANLPEAIGQVLFDLASENRNR